MIVIVLLLLYILHCTALLQQCSTRTGQGIGCLCERDNGTRFCFGEVTFRGRRHLSSMAVEKDALHFFSNKSDDEYAIRNVGFPHLGDFCSANSVHRTFSLVNNSLLRTYGDGAEQAYNQCAKVVGFCNATEAVTQRSHDKACCGESGCDECGGFLECGPLNVSKSVEPPPRTNKPCDDDLPFSNSTCDVDGLPGF